MVTEFTNEQGTKFTLHQNVTNWARREDVHGTSLPTVYCWRVETATGERTLLLMDGDTVLMEDTSLEAVSVRIDMMKAKKRMEADE